MKIAENVSLKNLNTFKIGGNARYFCEIFSVNDIKVALKFAKEKKLPIFILGGGSNVLISDDGFYGLVIKNSILGLELSELEDDKNIVLLKAGAGENWDDLVQFCVEKSLYGLENLSAIPGTVGASPVQNIGAYGAEVKDCIKKVFAINIDTLEEKIFENIECQFAYRNSFFKTKEGRRFIITAVIFKLSRKAEINFNYKDIKEYFEKEGIKNPSLKELREAVILIRAQKLPDLKKFGTAGSYFKNAIISKEKFIELKTQYPLLPEFSVGVDMVKVPTAWILDSICSLKGFKLGNVGLYEKQPLVFVNYGNGTAEEIISLEKKVGNTVFEKTGIKIESEVEKII